MLGNKPLLALVKHWALQEAIECQQSRYDLVIRTDGASTLDRFTEDWHAYGMVLLDAGFGMHAIAQFCEKHPQRAIVVITPEVDTKPYLKMGVADCIHPDNLAGGYFVSFVENTLARHQGRIKSQGWTEVLLRNYDLMEGIFSIVSTPGMGIDQKLVDVLEVGCQILGEEVGIISHIENDDYEVKYVYTDKHQIAQGDRFELKDTFCSITYAADRALSITDVEMSPYKTHPCTKLGLRSYFGVPINVNGKRYGTLNFSSSMVANPVSEENDLKLISILGAWVGTVLSRNQLIDELKLTAMYDSLTGLMNRESITEVIDRCLSRASHSDNYTFALLFLDVNKFKQINDTLGHLCGDQLLIELAKRLRSAIRPKDALGRFAGDEFIIVLQDVDKKVALTVANRILTMMQKPFKLGSVSQIVGVSIGIAMSQMTKDIETLLHSADLAMYSAKSSGVSVACYNQQEAG